MSLSFFIIIKPFFQRKEYDFYLIYPFRKKPKHYETPCIISVSNMHLTFPKFSADSFSSPGPNKLTQGIK